jgi:hypothetical protein
MAAGLLVRKLAAKTARKRGAQTAVNKLRYRERQTCSAARRLMMTISRLGAHQVNNRHI